MLRVLNRAKNLSKRPLHLNFWQIIFLSSATENLPVGIVAHTFLVPRYWKSFHFRITDNSINNFPAWTFGRHFPYKISLEINSLILYFYEIIISGIIFVRSTYQSILHEVRKANSVRRFKEWAKYSWCLQRPFKSLQWKVQHLPLRRLQRTHYRAS